MKQNFITWVGKELGANAKISEETYGDQSTVYRVHVPKGNYFLKIGSELKNERERLEWLGGKLPAPKVVGFANFGDKDALLMSAIEGINLAELSKRWSANKVIDKLVKALQKFHATDTKGCPFGSPGLNKVLVHGDACLPNFIFQDDSFSGYIDLGDLRIDNPEVDFAAAIWSLQYNLGPGYGLRFLEKYGIKNVTGGLVEKLRVQYEEMQQQWGLSK